MSVDLFFLAQTTDNSVTPDFSEIPLDKARAGDLQVAFLDQLRRTATSVTVFLVNGVKLQGVVAQADAETLLLRRDGHVQLVYKHAISTIMPTGAMPGFGAELTDGTP